MSNYTLVKPDNSTLAISVTDPGSTFDRATRGALSLSNAGMTYYVGDAQTIPKPITLTIRITDHQGDEASARAELASIREFAKAAQYLKRDATGKYLTLHAGYALAEINPKPIGNRMDAWTAVLTLLPKFPIWTSDAVLTVADYLRAVTGTTAALDFSDATNSQYAPLI